MGGGLFSLSNGPFPTITTTEAIGPMIRKPEEPKFNSPLCLPTESEKKKILYYVVKHGIYTVMTNHTYRWDNIYKLQLTGGPIRDKLACEVARLYMVWFDKKFRETLDVAGVLVTI